MRPKPKRNKHKPARTAAKSDKCECGCGFEVSSGRRFKQGHDARMRPNSSWRKAHPELFKH